MRKVLLVLILAAALILVLFCNLPNANAQSDLVAYWKFDEYSGSTTADSSGNANNGVKNGTIRVEGKHDYALHFDGESDYVVVPDSQSLNLTDAFTFSAWIYPRSFGNSKSGRIFDKNSTAAYAFYLRNWTSAYSDTFGITLGGNQYAAQNNSITLEKWQHIAVTFDKSLSSGQIKFYVDGVERGTATRTKNVPSNTHQLLIGIREDFNRSAFDGVIDELRIYNRALAAGEIQSAYQEESKNHIAGRLVDKNGNSVQATVSVGSASAETDASGNYILKTTSGTYDATYSVHNFFIPNFWVKLPLIVNSDSEIPLNNVTGYPSDNKLSFAVSGHKTVEAYSPNKPKSISANGKALTEVPSFAELKNNAWFYDATAKKVYIKVRDPSLPSLLHVSGSKIVDEDGNEVILRGFQWGQDGYIHGFMPLAREHFKKIKSMGFNIIEIGNFWTGSTETVERPTEPFQDQPQFYNEAGMAKRLDEIRAANDAGLYVLVSVRVCFDPDYTASGDYPWYGWATHDYVTLNQSDSAGQYGLDRFAKYLEWLTKGVQGEPNVVGIEPWHFPYHRQDPDSERVSKYFNNVVPAMLKAVRSHTDKMIFMSSPTLGHFNYSDHPGPFADSNIVYDTGGYGYHNIAQCMKENSTGVYYNLCTKWDYDVSKIIHPHPSAWAFREKYNVPIFSTEGPGLAQFPLSGYGRPLRQDRLDLMEAVLKMMDNLSGWIAWSYGGPREEEGAYWGILESNNPNDPAAEGQVIQIFKKYALS